MTTETQTIKKLGADGVAYEDWAADACMVMCKKDVFWCIEYYHIRKPVLVAVSAVAAIPAQNGQLAVAAMAAIPASPDKDIKEWMSANSMAKGWIWDAVSRNAKAHIKSFLSSDAKEMWDGLRAVYGKETAMSKMFALRKLLALRMLPSELPQAYIDRVQQLVNDASCCIVNRSIPFDHLVVSLILGTLDKRFDALRLTLEQQAGGDLAGVSYNTCLASLAAEGLRWSEGHVPTKDTSSSTNLFHIGQIGQQGAEFLAALNGMDSTQKDAVLCYVKQRNGQDNVFCNYCKKPGHLVDSCSILKAKKERVAAAAQKVATVTTSPSVSTSTSAFENLFTIGNTMWNTALSTGNVPKDTDTWIWDSGATSHCCFDRSSFATYTARVFKVKVYGDIYVTVEGTGSINLTTINKGVSSKVTLNNVLHVPTAEFNLVSQFKVKASGLHSIIDCDTHFQVVLKSTRKVILTYVPWNGFYRVQCSVAAGLPANIAGSECFFALSSSSPVPIRTLHERLGHVSKTTMSTIVSNSASKFTNLRCDGSTDDIGHCAACEVGKHKRLPFPTSTTIITEQLAVVVSDLSESNIRSIHGFKWFLTFTDVCTRFIWTYPLKTKDETFEIFKVWLAEVERESGNQLKLLRTDGGGEFIDGEFRTYLTERGIQFQLSCSNTPQQNGIAERINLTLWDMVRAMLSKFTTDKRLWADALMAASYIKNRIPHSAVKLIPFTAWYGQKPVLNQLRVMFCLGYIHIQDTTARKKLDDRAIPGVFAGYSTTKKAWRFYTTDLKKLHFTRDATFHESISGLTASLPIEPSLHLIDDENDDDNRSTATFQDEPAIAPATDLTPPPTPLVIPATLPVPVSTPITNTTPTPAAETATDRRLKRLQKQLAIDMKPDGGSRYRVTELVVNEQRDAEDVIGMVTQLRDLSSYDADVDQLSDFGASLNLIGSTTNIDIQPEQSGIIYSVVCDGSITSQSITDSDSWEYLNTAYQQMDSVTSDPTSYKEAMSLPDASLWTAAIQEEMLAHHENGSFELIPPNTVPSGANILTSRMVLKYKLGPTGNLERRKARLCIRGFTQKEGIDYVETFAPVVKYASVRIFLAIAALLCWTIVHMDVKTAFLNGWLKSSLYARQPEGAIVAGKEGWLMKLIRSIYGLKQSPRLWNEALDAALKGLGFKRLSSDQSVYILHHEGLLYMLLVYVDDLLLGGKRGDFFNDLSAKVLKLFRSRDLGVATFFLGAQLNIDHTRRIITLCQTTYIKSLLERFNLSIIHPIETPCGPEPLTHDMCPTNPEQRKMMANIPYQQAVGCLLHLSVCSRHDISFAVGRVARFMVNPGIAHWNAVIRIFRYLKRTINYALLFDGTCSTKLTAYADADWGGDTQGSKSTSGYMFFLFGAPISWRSSLQATVALSTTEAEYIALTDCMKEAIWISELLAELDIRTEVPELYANPDLFDDNKSAIVLCQDPVFHPRTKHIRIRFHFIREEILNKTAVLRYIPSADNVADILTKGLNKVIHNRLLKKLGLYDVKSDKRVGEF